MRHCERHGRPWARLLVVREEEREPDALLRGARAAVRLACPPIRWDRWGSAWLSPSVRSRGGPNAYAGASHVIVRPQFLPCRSAQVAPAVVWSCIHPS